ncbi:lactonase family protein [Marinicrinis lubricantis]|uniref:Lactonase family protein n=1 Tax=Marinicrinis lubricantis TaxID=2086470 RepID=A0ABW1IP26_9BACL
MAAANHRLLVFAGSYAEAEGSGVYVYEFDEQTVELRALDAVSGLKNPTFLNVDAAQKKLYAIGEVATAEGGKAAEAVSFAIDPETGKLSMLNRAQTVSSPTCHIQRDQDRRYLIVSSYHGGMVGLVSITEEGKVGDLLDVQQHEGKSVHPERQDRPHPHSAFFSPDEKYIFVSDLGLDRIRAYRIDKEQNQLKLHGETAVHPGAGPRHLVFHPNGRFTYVINEVDSTITVFSYDMENGQLNEIETVPTLPSSFEGENTCAEITLSKDGKYLYGSNRGHDSIVVYAINSESGKLTLVEHVSTEGEHPRHFALTPSGTHLLAANRDTNNIAVFQVDRTTGKLTYTGKQVQVSKPVCVQPLYL